MGKPTFDSKVLTQMIGKLTVISKIKVDQNWENQEKYIHFFLRGLHELYDLKITNMTLYKGTKAR